jgi:outer membrane protein, heavy metal efflux system
MKPSACWAIVACVTWPATPFAAAEPLSLNAAVDLAVAQSADIGARVATVEAATALVAAAGQRPDPELVVGIEDVPLSGQFAYSLSRDDFTMRKIGVMQSFPRRIKRQLRSQRASDDVQLTRAAQQLAELDIKRQVAEAWIALYIAEQALHRLLNLESGFELQSRVATAGVASGRSPTADALASQAALLEFRDRIRGAEQAANRARARLAQWLPDDANRPLAAAPDFGSLPSDASQLQADIHRHAAVLSFDAAIEAARTDIALAQAEKRADWSVELDYSNRSAPYSDMVSLQFRVGLPLFGKQRLEPMIAAKRAELRRVQAQREGEIRRHTAEVSEQLVDWQALKLRVASYDNELVPLARARALAALAAFQAAQTPIKAVLEARATEVDAQLQALALRLQWGNTWAYLSYLQRPGSLP